MQKLNRLCWAAGVKIVSYGVRIGVRTNRPEYLRQIIERLPPIWRSTAHRYVDGLYSVVVGGSDPRWPSLRRFHVVYEGSRMLHRSFDLDETLDALESSLHFFTALNAPRKIFVHAGVVAWRGRAILLPGRSLAGKTTLVAALLRAGASYLSDEYAVLDQDGRVYPYPKPLTLRHQRELAERRGRCAPSVFRSKVVNQALPVGLIVVTQFEPGASWRPRALSQGQAVLGLLANTVRARNRPQSTLAALAGAASKAGRLSGPRGEADGVVQAILNHLGRGESVPQTSKLA